jgi:hypothetical protein
MTLAGRRLRNATLALAAFLTIAGALWLHHVALRDISFSSGWLLVGAFVVLAAYNLRKKLPFLPLADSASWMQLHIYLGLLAVGVFLLHTGLSLPNGILESSLWATTVLLLASGLLGLAVTRSAPRGLTEHGERVIFERIPVLRAQLAREVRELVEASAAAGSSETLASYYPERLQPFFARPRNLARHLLGSRVPLQRLCRELQALKRYMSEADADRLDRIEDCVIAKDNLDYQYAWQGVLKGWLFLHIPLTYATAVLATVHVALAYAYASATP